MKIKIFPKNEQEFSKFFIVLIPFLLLLFGGISLLKEAYFLFVNILPENIVFNYGFLDKLNNHITYSLLLSFLIVFLTSYLLPKTLGRRLVIFPIFFLTSLGVIGLESLDLLLGFLFPNNFYSFGNTSYTMIFKVLILFCFCRSFINKYSCEKRSFYVYKCTIFIWSSYILWSFINCLSWKFCCI